LKSKELIRDFGVCHQSYIETLCLTHCGSFLFSAGDDKSILQWEFSVDQTDMKVVNQYHLDLGCYFLAMATDRRLLFGSVGYEGDVYRWNIIDKNTKMGEEYDLEKFTSNNVDRHRNRIIKINEENNKVPPYKSTAKTKKMGQGVRF
jgi:hypothetical protein